jgi:hypothetical protein
MVRRHLFAVVNIVYLPDPGFMGCRKSTYATSLLWQIHHLICSCFDITTLQNPKGKVLQTKIPFIEGGKEK